MPSLGARKHNSGESFAKFLLLLVGCLTCFAFSGQAQSDPTPVPQTPSSEDLRSAEEWNRRVEELLASAEPVSITPVQEYRIGAEDLLDITVFEAPELNRSVRVTAGGEVYLPLLGGVQAAGLTPRELELVLQELLRRTYMKDPHVGVFVREMQSHPVAVFGAVQRPGVYQLSGTRTLLEVLSMAEGLAEDAGDTVIIMRGTGFRPLLVSNTENSEETDPSDPERADTQLTSRPTQEIQVEETIRINLKDLLETGDPRYNVPIHPGDIVKVTRAGIVYVVGDVNKPGGFQLESNENISLLQAIALAEGTTSTSAKSRTLIIRTAKDGSRTEIPVDLGKILEGENSDPMLQPNDIVFVPNSAAKTVALRGIEAVVRTVSGLIIFGAR